MEYLAWAFLVWWLISILRHTKVGRPNKVTSTLRHSDGEEVKPFRLRYFRRSTTYAARLGRKFSHKGDN
jgi:hypothetical protein